MHNCRETCAAAWYCTYLSSTDLCWYSVALSGSERATSSRFDPLVRQVVGIVQSAGLCLGPVLTTTLFLTARNAREKGQRDALCLGAGKTYVPAGIAEATASSRGNALRLLFLVLTGRTRESSLSSRVACSSLTALSQKAIPNAFESN